MDFNLKFLLKFVGKYDQAQKGVNREIVRPIDLLGHPFFVSKALSIICITTISSN